MTVHVNESCIGCTLCVSMSPDIFQMNDEGTATAQGAIFSAQVQPAQAAAESCPVNAIEVEQ